MADLDRPPIVVEVTEASVREFRVRFTGSDAYRGPVEVRAYGRLVGHWFPARTLPAAISPGASRREGDGVRGEDRGVRILRAGHVKRRKAPTAKDGQALSDRQAQRDEWLRKMMRRRTTGSGY